MSRCWAQNLEPARLVAEQLLQPRPIEGRIPGQLAISANSGTTLRGRQVSTPMLVRVRLILGGGAPERPHDRLRQGCAMGPAAYAIGCPAADRPGPHRSGVAASICHTTGLVTPKCSHTGRGGRKCARRAGSAIRLEPECETNRVKLRGIIRADPSRSHVGASTRSVRFMLVQDTRSPIGFRYPDNHREAGKPEFRGPIVFDRGKASLVLPPADTKRWSSRRKAAVVVAMRTGIITREEACERYLISNDELVGWEAAFDRSGIPGLRVTSQCSYRRQHLSHSEEAAPAPAALMNPDRG